MDMTGSKRRLASVMFLVALLAGVWWCAHAADSWAENHSTSTACAEEDNINVPIFAPRVDRYRIVATHPSYCPCVYDGCPADFTNCPPGSWGVADTCSKIFDDGLTVVRVCTVGAWWRASSMDVSVNGGGSTSCHYVILHRRIADESSWPEVLVLYEDGNLRIKPHPPAGATDVCYGSSVIVGPATLGPRPYADVEAVQITVGSSSVRLDVTYGGGETAAIDFTVDRTRAIADVATTGFPDHVAVLRSMWVADGNSDVDSVETAAGTKAILTGWTNLEASAWFFHRQVVSMHNTSAPDIRIVLDTASAFRVDSTGTVYADGELHSAAILAGAADIAEWVPTSTTVMPGDVLEVDPTSPGTYRRSVTACSPFVAGVASTEPGVILGFCRSAGGALLALAGIVPVRVTAEGGPIAPGDLLVSSSTPGHAMRWAGDGPCPCALVGKAMGALLADWGVILVLLASP